MRLVANQRHGDRWLNVARVIGLVALISGLVLLAVVIFTQSVEKANSWAGSSARASRLSAGSSRS